LCLKGVGPEFLACLRNAGAGVGVGWVGVSWGGWGGEFACRRMTHATQTTHETFAVAVVELDADAAIAMELSDDTLFLVEVR
jgi:hypothetical protein